MMFNSLICAREAGLLRVARRFHGGVFTLVNVCVRPELEDQVSTISVILPASKSISTSRMGSKETNRHNDQDHRNLRSTSVFQFDLREQGHRNNIRHSSS